MRPGKISPLSLLVHEKVSQIAIAFAARGSICHLKSMAVITSEIVPDKSILPRSHIYCM